MRSLVFGVFLVFSSASLFAEANTAAPTVSPNCFPDALTNQTNVGPCTLSAQENLACPPYNTQHSVWMDVNCPNIGDYVEDFYNWGSNVAQIQNNFIIFMANNYNISAVCATTSGFQTNRLCTNAQQSFQRVDCNFQIPNVDTLEPACNSGSSLAPSWTATTAVVGVFLALTHLS